MAFKLPPKSATPAAHERTPLEKALAAVEPIAAGETALGIMYKLTRNVQGSPREPKYRKVRRPRARNKTRTPAQMPPQSAQAKGRAKRKEPASRKRKRSWGYGVDTDTAGGGCWSGVGQSGLEGGAVTCAKATAGPTCAPSLLGDTAVCNLLRVCDSDRPLCVPGALRARSASGLGVHLVVAFALPRIARVSHPRACLGMQRTAEPVQRQDS